MGYMIYSGASEGWIDCAMVNAGLVTHALCGHTMETLLIEEDVVFVMILLQ